MCGIFGFVPAAKTFEPNFLAQAAAQLFRLSETRGKEASGFAAVLGDSLQVLKRPWRASQLVKSAEYRRLIAAWDSENLRRGSDDPARPLIGHSRLVTNGSRETHFNNQPVIGRSAAGVHNGIVVNVDELWQVHPELERRYEVDSEVIFALIEHFARETQSISEAARRTFEEILGATSIAALFSDLDLLLLATNNGSLYYVINGGPFALAFASEEQILTRFLQRYAPESVGEIRQLAPGQGLSFGEGTASAFSLSRGGGSTGILRRNDPARPILDVEPPLESSAAASPPAAAKLPERFERHVRERFEAVARLKRCTRCILPETMPFISFDRDGVCSFCKNYRPISLYGADALEKLASAARNRTPIGKSNCDCVVAISGGRDSCYGLHYIKKELGLRPVTYTYDWGMVTDLARRNISRLCGALGVEHILISADIVQKRDQIRKNVAAWLRQPELGTIPLFMAGDKHFYYYAHQLKKQFHTELMFLSENQLEKTNFKSGFAGVPPAFETARSGVLPWSYKLSLAGYYLKQFAKNPAYLNSSLLDTTLAYGSYYVLPHDFVFLFHYLRWDEHQIVSTLRNVYDWELAADTASTWRIGDGTAPFYNYIYLNAAGFTEYDSFRSNQIREGQITREEALHGLAVESQPRWDSIRWYLDAIHLDFDSTIESINRMPSRLRGAAPQSAHAPAGESCAE